MVTIKYKIGYTDDTGHHYATTWWGTEDEQEAVESFEKWTFYTVDEIERIINETHASRNQGTSRNTEKQYRQDD